MTRLDNNNIMYFIGDPSRIVWSYPNLGLCVSHIAAAPGGNDDTLAQYFGYATLGMTDSNIFPMKS